MNIFMDRVVKKFITRGHLQITFSNGTVKTYGNGTGKAVHLRFNNRRAEWNVLFNPQYYLGHEYAIGGIDLLDGDMFDLLRIIFSENDNERKFTPWTKLIAGFRYVFRHLRENNVIHRARANVKHHYDLTGALYDLFLDSDRQYSCAYFETSEADLETAQLAKKRHIAAKMVMNRPDLSVLDIGCGWGGMALYLARYLGARVTGITLSDEQLTIAKQRGETSGLQDALSFELRDYRHVTQTFDRIVSVGMFEHVGRPHFDTYFQKSASILKKDGVMLLHTIGRLDRPTSTNAFIEKYIFPGGYIPALSEITPAIQRSGLKITDVEILRIHYADTLKAWRERFIVRREEAKAIYDEKFCRIWEFYLASSECAFRWQGLAVFQIQLAHRQDIVPLTRDYIGQAEAALRHREEAVAQQPQRFPHEAAE